ncbi:hypothetical protein [Hwangdonia lutea]|uniref:Uncharacterized protein n=1 Tax=Hwangdonia lutea TaxID=3075823 RepID=A0AA97EIX8_9FLAO|nr:hypothetical protein [Hwangdonia sp. SCSIO 19198]WOD42284.1 hypothetical protein RNZ46_09770 [Hwangdonia sp. SCSIO 19198]
MKILHYINCFFYLITIVPYITIYYFFIGLYAQIILGIAQLVIAIIISLYVTKHSRINKRHISNYWIAALTNLLVILILFKTNFTNNETITTVFLFILPMLIASYFVYITYSIQKQ